MKNVSESSRQENKGHFSQNRPVGVGSGMPFHMQPMGDGRLPIKTQADILRDERIKVRTQACMDKLSTAKTVLKFMQILHDSLDGITHDNPDDYIDLEPFNALVDKLPPLTVEEKSTVDKLVEKINESPVLPNLVGVSYATYKLENLYVTKDYLTYQNLNY